MAACVVLGCGGGGGPQNPNPYVGTWNGTFTTNASEINQVGTVSIDIATDGTAHGTFTNTTYDRNGIIDGSFTNAGFFRGTITYFSVAPGSGGTDRLYGLFAATTGGLFTGNLSEAAANGIVVAQVDFTLTKG